MKDSKKDAKVYLDDMLGAIAKIKKFTAGMAKGRFRANRMAFDATVRNLEILGEAASKLPSSFRDSHKGIEWGKIIGMRNRLIHAYDDVNFDIVWDAIKYDVPVKYEGLFSFTVSKVIPAALVLLIIFSQMSGLY